MQPFQERYVKTWSTMHGVYVLSEFNVDMKGGLVHEVWTNATRQWVQMTVEVARWRWLWHDKVQGQHRSSLVSESAGTKQMLGVSGEKKAQQKAHL